MKMPGFLRKVASFAAIVLLGFGLAACDVDVEEEGRLPDVDVEGGKAPEVDVRGPDVDVEPEERVVTVPDVDVDVDGERKRVTVPYVDVDTPGE